MYKRQLTGTVTAQSVPSVAASSGAKASSGFLGTVKDTVVSGLKHAGKAVVGTVATNLLLTGNVYGDREVDPLYRTGESSRSAFGTPIEKADTTFKYAYPEMSADTVGNTYVALLSNLNYGNGSMNYALNTNRALMAGVQIPQIQYV